MPSVPSVSAAGFCNNIRHDVIFCTAQNAAAKNLPEMERLHSAISCGPNMEHAAWADGDGCWHEELGPWPGNTSFTRLKMVQHKCESGLQQPVIQLRMFFCCGKRSCAYLSCVS
jgi:hypothetical protein